MWNLIGYVNAAFWIIVLIEWIRGWRRMEFLRDITPDGQLPSLTVVIPACNEASRLARALESICMQDYPALQIILINDRSTDATGQVAESIAQKYPQVRVIHVTELPSGWLGKNHALYIGSQRAMGEWILFTDADVSLAPHALAASVSYAKEHDIDHLVVLPQPAAKTFIEKVILNCFSFLFALRHNPWRAANPRSRYYIGIGAFNLIRRDTYNKIGTYAAFPMEILDDVELGRHVKAHGYIQRSVYGTDVVTLPWYAGIDGAVSGYNKNFFAAMEYSSLRVAAAITGLLLFGILPCIGIWFVSGYSVLLYSVALVALGIIFMITGKITKIPVFPYVLGTPLGIMIFGWILIQSCWSAYKIHGIAWRGTVYSLADLRRARRMVDQTLQANRHKP